MIDRDRLVELALQLVSTPSFTGSEEESDGTGHSDAALEVVAEIEAAGGTAMSASAATSPTPARWRRWSHGRRRPGAASMC